MIVVTTLTADPACERQQVSDGKEPMIIWNLLGVRNVGQHGLVMNPKIKNPTEQSRNGTKNCYQLWAHQLYKK